MDVIDYEASHLEQISLQEGQAYLSGWVTPGMAESLEDGPSYTGKVGDRIIICSGIVPMWQGRAVAWAYLDRTAGEHMVAITRAVKRFLENCYIRRIEATVDVGFQPGHRWMRVLGFELEAPVMRHYRPDGADCSLYARVR